jgi:ketosteroid isomerase-like protein
MDEAEAAKAQVLAAAGRLLDAFSQNRIEDYFACFAPDATFIFHGLGHRLGSLADYRSAWHGWVRDVQLRILGASAQQQTVDLIAPGVALYTHSVQVRASVAGAVEQRRERETIVFVRLGEGRWLAVHEHLSKDPNA